MSPVPNRYTQDVLSAGWQRAGRPKSVEHELTAGLVVEDATTGFCGAVARWENGLVVLEDRKGKLRSFPLGAGFLVEGRPVILTAPKRSAKVETHTRSGSRRSPADAKAKVALPSRIYVEGRHDAELIEKIWGDDLRHVGVVVEYLGGIDDLPAIVEQFGPEPGHRLGVLVDHLVPGSKEQRIADTVADGPHGEFTFVTGHQFIDIWEAIKPERVGLNAWPRVPKGTDWKKGVCAAMGWPHQSQADIANVWNYLLGRVDTWSDLDTRLLTEVERLIDFVLQDHDLG